MSWNPVVEIDFFLYRVMWGQLVHGGETYSCSLRHIFISMMTSRLMEKKKEVGYVSAICNHSQRRLCFDQVRKLIFRRSDIIFRDADLVCHVQQSVVIMLIYISTVRLVIFPRNQVK